MKYLSNLPLLLLIFLFETAFASENIEQSNGISYPKQWKSWGTIAVSDRTDNKTSRVILGNDIALSASRRGETNPWPEGTIIAKAVWKNKNLEHWTSAVVPGDFVHVEFMVKNSVQYEKTGGWGWARWIGLDLEAFNHGEQSCTACHTPVKDNDWVYTEPAIFP